MMYIYVLIQQHSQEDVKTSSLFSKENPHICWKKCRMYSEERCVVEQEEVSKSEE